jgi:hypothetical protein
MYQAAQQETWWHMDRRGGKMGADPVSAAVTDENLHGRF